MSLHVVMCGKDECQGGGTVTDVKGWSRVVWFVGAFGMVSGTGSPFQKFRCEPKAKNR